MKSLGNKKGKRREALLNAFFECGTHRRMKTGRFNYYPSMMNFIDMGRAEDGLLFAIKLGYRHINHSLYDYEINAVSMKMLEKISPGRKEMPISYIIT